MTDIVVVDGARTPHGALLGGFADLGAVDLGTRALDGLLERVDLDPGMVDYVTVGHAIQAATGQVPGRQAVYASRLPKEVPVTTVNEAFAAQIVHVMDRVGVPHDRPNTRGGAVAYGHLIGASGGMIAASLLYELERKDLARGSSG
ncbi:MAG: hypothetical protein V5A62_18885 [Haloarculaceae archaeon]